MPANLRENRYARQLLLPDLGPAGQARFARAQVVIVGCGALGSVAAELLARAGVGLREAGGELRLIDRDVVEISNLHRQTLYDDADARAGTPKAIAAAHAIARTNPDVRATPLVADCTSASILDLVGTSPTLLLDGTDNFETRFLLNDLAVSRGVPLIYAGAVGTRGMLATILPAPRTGAAPAPWRPGPCLRCLTDIPAPGSTETCDTAGVLGPVSAAVASFQTIEAMKVVLGRFDLVQRQVQEFDPWRGVLKNLTLDAPDPKCPCCGEGRFDFLDAPPAGSLVLCGSDAVQITPKATGVIDLAGLADRLARCAHVEATPWMVRGELPGETRDGGGGAVRLSVFRDGRAIIRGTRRLDRARALYAKFIGS